MTTEATDRLLAYQDHLAELLAADPAFAGIPIYTERHADLEQQIETAIDDTAYFLIIATARAQSLRQTPEDRELRMAVTTVITITHNPTLDPDNTWNATRAVGDIIRLLDGAPNKAGLTAANTFAGNRVRVESFEYVAEAAARGLAAQQIIVETTLNYF